MDQRRHHRLSTSLLTALAVAAFLECADALGQTPLSNEDCAKINMLSQIERLQNAVNRKPASTDEIRRGLEELKGMVQKQKRCTSSSITTSAPGTVDTRLGQPGSRPSPGEMLGRINRSHQSVRTPTAQGKDPSPKAPDMNQMEVAIGLLDEELQKASPDGDRMRSIVSSIRADN